MELNFLDLYTSLVRANSLLPNPSSEISNKIEGFKTTVTNPPENPEHYVGEYYVGISEAICEIADKIQDYVDDLKRLSSDSSHLRGITKHSKINIMLLGETSAGKTTFLERIYGENCGATGPNPITAFAVIHKTTNQAKSYLQVSFNEKFVFDDDKTAELFKDFLKRYNFYEQFEINKNEFAITGDVFPPVQGRNKIMDFVKEANTYPKVFDEIVWYHKESRYQLNFTKFADFIDMPGSGGMAEHSENIDFSINRYGKDVDVVLYLIKPDGGVPSSYNLLKTLKTQLDAISSDPMLYFVYQRKNNDDFAGKVGSLKEFINKDETSDAIDPFNSEEREYFSDALVLDSRGPKDDRIMVNIALSSLLRDFFIRKGRNFYDSLYAVNTPKEFEILDAGDSNEPGINSHLFKFLKDTLEETAKESIGGKMPEISKIKDNFKQKFCIDGDFTKPSFNDDLKSTIVGLKNEINISVDSLFDYLATSSGFLGSKTRFLDTTKFGMDFYNTYKTETSWKSLMYNIQVLHWLRLSYNGNQLKDLYAKNVADSIMRTFREYLDRMESITNEIPVEAGLK